MMRIGYIFSIRLKSNEWIGPSCNQQLVYTRFLRRSNLNSHRLPCARLTLQVQRHSQPARKVTPEVEARILALRSERKLGARRIQNELAWHNGCELSLGTIHKVLKRNAVPPCRKPHRKKVAKRCSAPIPGQRVQLDTCKLRPGLYLYRAIDDCSRFLADANPTCADGSRHRIYGIEGAAPLARVLH
jgi:hypothetical protein